ncbi:MAG: hypothetical protein ACOCZ8_06605, partial [Bacteroidota bacterium]
YDVRLKHGRLSELGLLVPLLVLIVLMGVYATPFLNEIEHSVNMLMSNYLSAGDIVSVAR